MIIIRLKPGGKKHQRRFRIVLTEKRRKLTGKVIKILGWYDPQRKEYSLEKEETYKAAEPDARPGVYHNVIALDLHAAYPSVVIALNASAESKNEGGKYIAPNGVRFDDSKSVFVETLKDILNEREKIKKKLKSIDKSSLEFRKYKSIDFALKTQAAAFSHGEFGYWRSRTKDYEVAEAITSTAKDFIFYIMEKCDELGYRWIYEHSVSPDTPLLLKRKSNLQIVMKNF